MIKPRGMVYTSTLTAMCIRVTGRLISSMDMELRFGWITPSMRVNTMRVRSRVEEGTSGLMEVIMMVIGMVTC